MTEHAHTGRFVISLDFELFWGMFDKVTLAEYGGRIRGERTAIPRMLATFSEYGIHATWGTVGMLMARDRTELMALLPPPSLRPTYEHMEVSAYRYMETAHLGESEADDVYHYGSDLVRQILATPNQELANHTFSHFYCIDGHENAPSIFEADLTAHEAIAATYGVKAESIIFPRNQADQKALMLCSAHGIRAYRGNEKSWIYAPRKDDAQSLLIRGIRLIDHYVNLTGHHTYSTPTPHSGLPVNVPASRFLRPWSKGLRVLEPLRMRRIKRAMTHAAKNGEVFHLWWHPHNFGIDQEENFTNLREILEHFKMLSHEYGMESASMRDIATIADGRGA